MITAPQYSALGRAITACGSLSFREPQYAVTQPYTAEVQLR